MIATVLDLLVLVVFSMWMILALLRPHPYYMF